MDAGVAWLPSARAVKWKFGFKKRAQPLTLTTNVSNYVYIKETAVLSQRRVGITSSRYDLSFRWAGHTMCYKENYNKMQNVMWSNSLKIFVCSD